MAKATFILGLCGSGKTYLLEKLSKDAIRLEADKDKEYLRTLLKHLRAGRDCVIEDITMCTEAPLIPLWTKPRCRRTMRKKLSLIGVDIEWLAFENDLKKANRNLARRKKRSVPIHLEINRFLTRRYTYPEGAIILSIYN